VNCAAANERLLELVYDDVKAADWAELQRHVEQCKPCSAELAALRRTRESLDRWQVPAPMPGTQNLIRIAARPYRAALIGAAAMLVFCVGSVGVFGTVERSGGGLAISIPLLATKPPVGDEYLLLLYSNIDDEAALSIEENQARVAEYARWAQELGRQGQLVAAEELDTRDARTMQRSGDELRVAAVAANAPGQAVAGFFHIRAESPEQAAKVAAQCPHLKHGGRVEVRRIQKTK